MLPLHQHPIRGTWCPYSFLHTDCPMFPPLLPLESNQSRLVNGQQHRLGAKENYAYSTHVHTWVDVVPYASVVLRQRIGLCL